MRIWSPLLRWTGLCTLGFFVYAVAGVEAQASTQDTQSAGLITLNSSADAKEKKMPAVVFKHDRHATILASVEENCQACHKPLRNGSLDFAFLLIPEKTGDLAKDAFHKDCITCHQKYASEGKSTGPLETGCRSCHQDNKTDIVAVPKTNFYDKLHDAHVEYGALQLPNGESNCVTCHHTGFDEATGKYIGTPDAGEACANCHLPQAELQAKLAKDPKATDDYGPLAKRLDLKNAEHAQCISCHLSIAAKNPGDSNGPVKCAGCHK